MWADDMDEEPVWPYDVAGAAPSRDPFQAGISSGEVSSSGVDDGAHNDVDAESGGKRSQSTSSPSSPRDDRSAGSDVSCESSPGRPFGRAAGDRRDNEVREATPDDDAGVISVRGARRFTPVVPPLPHALAQTFAPPRT